MKKTVKNVAASVRDRLLAGAHQRREDFTLTLQRYAAERFLYRLGESRYRDQFVLKGAMLFALWGGPIYRPTRDLDFAGYGSSEAEDVIGCFREIFALTVEDDGLVLDDATLAAEPIRDDAEYDGLRVRFRATFGTAYIPMQIDVGFGNAIEPPANDVDYPTLLDLPAPRIRAYPHEAVVAEKLHAMVLLGERTSRFKDFYDLYVLARQFPFGGQCLTRAIGATFERRRTRIDTARPAALAPRFFAEPLRAAQWRTYLDRNRLPGAPAAFDAVGEQLRAFLGPPWDALAEKSRFQLSWQPGGQWGAREAGSRTALTLSTPTRREDLEPASARAQTGVVSGAMEQREMNGTFRRFKPYPAYKDSGVEWLREIPAHWEVQRLKFVAPTRISKVDAKPDDAVYVGLEHVESWTGRLLLDRQPETVDSVVCSFSAGDVLFGKLRPYLAKAARPEFDGVCTSEILAFRPTAKCAQSFLMFCLLNAAYIRWVDSLTYGTKMPRVSPEQVAGSAMPLPSIEEQRAIAAFLDRETATIDALVAKKERLIELLQEKRTVLITRAVTKGINPNVPMKDSGVEWLGEIPAHWQCVPLRRSVLSRAGAIKTGPFGSQLLASEMQGGDVKVYNQRNVIDRDFASGENFVSREKFKELSAFAVCKGDVLVTTRGTIGRCAIVPEDAEEGILHPCLMRIQPDPKQLLRSYLALLIQDSILVQTQLALASNATTIDVIYSDTMGRILVPKPPLEEQAAIVGWVGQRTCEVDSLIKKVSDAIDRLKELRTALISAAVTGKINVREEVV